MAPDVYTYDIADIVCYLFQYYIQQQHHGNLQHLCYHQLVSTPADKYSLVQEKLSTFYVRSSEFQLQFN